MWRVTAPVLRNYRSSIKYPALVSYNKLPWEVVNHGSTTLHMHVAPHYEQILTTASTTAVPHLVCDAHPRVSPAQRLRVLPGRVYLMRGDALPADFTAHLVADATALQYYGRLGHVHGELHCVRMLTSDDLRLLCLAVTFARARLPMAPTSSLAHVASPACGDNNNSSSSSSSTNSADTASSTMFTLYHYMRPNRPAAELTRPLEKFYVHRPDLSMLCSYDTDGSSSSSSSGNNGSSTPQTWTPRLSAVSPPQQQRPRRASPMPAYTPPQSYLMGLAERLAVVPGSCFGRRSLMWGHWF